jgi:transposase
MRRYELTDEQWQLVVPLLPRQRPGGVWRDHRQVVNGILWHLFSGAPWRDQPRRYGPFTTAHRRLTMWQRDGTWARVLEALQVRADDRGLIDWSLFGTDSTSIRASRAAAGARKKGGRRTSRPTTAWA